MPGHEKQLDDPGLPLTGKLGLSILPDSEIKSLTQAMTRLDESAWESFYKQYHHRLLSYHLKLCYGDFSLASDVIQETLLRIVRHIKVFKNEKDFWRWLACLSRCSCMDAGRSRTSYSRLLEKWSHHLETNKQSNVEVEDSDTFIEEFMTSLSNDEQYLFHLRYWNGLTIKELASTLSKSEKSIEYQLSNLRKKAKHWFSSQHNPQ